MRASCLCLVSLVAGAACQPASPKDGTDGGSSDAGWSDAGSPDAGPADAGFQFGAPITATTGQWTWVPFPNSSCANGAPTGIGVNLSATGSRVLIYLEGGGACWSDLTCFTLMTASYFTTGYTEANFEEESTDTTYLAMPGGFFDRTSSTNPFQDYSYVYVPYCTGDLHAGDNVVQYPSGTADFVGFKNITAYLERIVPTFPSAPRVYLAGSSAGGLGALYNWWQTQQAFGSIRVDMIDDSGTLMPPDIEADGMSQQPSLTAWNVAATLPPGCTACTTRLDSLYGFYAQTYPNQHAALLSYAQDSVLPSYYGITTAQFTQGLDEEITTYFSPSSPLKYYVNSGSGHVLWLDPTLTTNGVTVEAFLTLMTTDDPSWADVQP